MNAVATAVQPPVQAAAPPARQMSPDRSGVAEDRQAPLDVSLSEIPAVQRKCAACAAASGDDEMPVRPRLEVGPVNDPFEREADSIAAQVMAMPEPATGPAGTEAFHAPSVVQRACSSCGGDHDDTIRRMPAFEALSDEASQPRMRALVRRVTEEGDDAEGAVQRREAPGAGGETIGASAAQLTSGGRALPEATRSFYEDRMGRDLSGVRVHEGGEADRLNSSISARAFTYENHVWLSRSEGTAPSFTLAHELAHVLQQTAPGPVMARRAATRAVPKVQRTGDISDTLFFRPTDKVDKYHDLAVQDATNTSNVLGEVRVPNANRNGFRIPSEATAKISGTGFGYADIVKTDNSKLWGVGFVKPGNSQSHSDWFVAGTPSTPGQSIGIGEPTIPRSLGYDKTRSSLKKGGKSIGGSASQTEYWDNSVPRWVGSGGGFLRDATGGPGSYEIADMKFAGDKSRVGAASDQVKHYVKGFNFAAKNYNEIVGRSEKNRLASNTTGGTNFQNKALSKTRFNASKMRAAVGTASFKPIGEAINVKLAEYKPGLINPEKGRWDDVSKTTYPGRAYYRQNPTDNYLWEYVFWPDAPTEKDDPSSRSVRKTSLTDASKDLYDQLVASPSHSKLKPRKVGQRATAAPPRVQTKKAKKPLPPKKDLFVENFDKWKTEQKAFTKTYSGYTDPVKGTGKKEITKLAFDVAMKNTMRELGGGVPAGTAPMLSTTALTTSQKEYNKATLIEGRSGRMLGTMRKTFGTTFVKALNIYERLKTKFEDFLKGKKKRTSGGKIGKAIMKIGGMIFGTIFKTMLPQIGAYLVDCVEAGFKGMMDDILKMDFSEVTETMEKEFTEKYDEIAKKIEDTVEAAADAIKTRFGSIYEAVMDKWETAKTLISIAKHAFNVARLAACAAGGLETLGISCVVAGVDYLLSLFDASPSEALLSHLLGSCVAQELITEFILGRAIIRNLPREIAETIRKNLKELLPPEVNGLICDSISDVPDLPEPSEIPCEDLTGTGTGTGTDLSKPPYGTKPSVLDVEPTKKQKRKGGTVDPNLIPDDPKDVVIPDETRKLLKPEDPLPEGTRDVWEPEPAPDVPEDDLDTVPDVEIAPDDDTAKPGTDTDDTQKGGGGGEGRSNGDQDIRRGKIEGPTHKVSTYFTIFPGPSGGFPYGKGDGKTLFNVYIYAQTSTRNTYGPLPITIKIIEVHDLDTGDEIDFEPDGTYTMRNGTMKLQVDPVQLRGDLRSNR